jgi:hypothetical protein
MHCCKLLYRVCAAAPRPWRSSRAPSAQRAAYAARGREAHCDWQPRRDAHAHIAVLRESHELRMRQCLAFYAFGRMAPATSIALDGARGARRRRAQHRSAACAAKEQRRLDLARDMHRGVTLSRGQHTGRQCSARAARSSTGSSTSTAAPKQHVGRP